MDEMNWHDDMQYDDEELEEEDEYVEPADITKFCRALEEAWKLTPDLRLHRAFDLIFDGYAIDQITPEEMQEMLDDYILQNTI